MPLIKSTSKQALGKNIAAEIRAGKPADQAAAIAYSVKRDAAKKKSGGHSRHIEELGSAYEQSVSSGARQPWHATVVASRKSSEEKQ